MFRCRRDGIGHRDATVLFLTHFRHDHRVRPVRDGRTGHDPHGGARRQYPFIGVPRQGFTDDGKRASDRRKTHQRCPRHVLRSHPSTDRTNPGTDTSARTSVDRTRPTHSRSETASAGSGDVCSRRNRSTSSTSARSVKPLIRTSRIVRPRSLIGRFYARSRGSSARGSSMPRYGGGAPSVPICQTSGTGCGLREMVVLVLKAGIDVRGNGRPQPPIRLQHLPRRIRQGSPPAARAA